MADYQTQTSYMFQIDNFLDKKGWTMSPKFLSGGSEWHVKNFLDDHLHVYLCVQDPKLLQTGWGRRAHYRFSLLNKSGKALYTGTERSNTFCALFPEWGHKTLSLSKLKEEGFLENNKLIIKADVEVVKSTDEGEVTGKEMLNFNGFEVLYTQVSLVSRIFAKHPDIDVDFRPKDKGVKTAYMNLLLCLIETLRKPPHGFTETELDNAHSQLSELTEAGFKLDWLKTKLEDLSLERKVAIGAISRVEEMEDRIKNMELSLSELKVELKSEKVKSATAATKLLSFEDIL